MLLQVSREEGEEEALHRLSPQFVSLEEVEEGEAGQGRLERENIRLKEQVDTFFLYLTISIEGLDLCLPPR